MLVIFCLILFTASLGHGIPLPEYIITIPLSDFNEEDITVRAREGNILEIQAIHKQPDGTEISYIDFRDLPSNVSDTGDWKFEDGVLTIIHPFKDLTQFLAQSSTSLTTLKSITTAEKEFTITKNVTTVDSPKIIQKGPVTETNFTKELMPALSLLDEDSNLENEVLVSQNDVTEKLNQLDKDLKEFKRKIDLEIRVFENDLMKERNLLLRTFDSGLNPITEHKTSDINSDSSDEFEEYESMYKNNKEEALVTEIHPNMNWNSFPKNLDEDLNSKLGQESRATESDPTDESKQYLTDSDNNYNVRQF